MNVGNAGNIHVSRYMTPFVRVVGPDDQLEYARECLDNWRVSALAVVEDEGEYLRLRGVLSRTDLLHAGRVVSDNGANGRFELPRAPVRSIMTEAVVSVRRDDCLRDAAKLMVEHRIHRVFVEHDGALVGVLAGRDVMRAIADDGITGELGDYMSSPVTSLHADASVGTALRVLEDEHISGLVVIDREWPCGVFTQEEALHARRLAVGTALSRAMNPAILVLPDTMPLHRAAANAASVDVRRVIVSHRHHMVGIMSSLDFCRAIL